MHPETGELIGIYFHAHRNHDGCWVAAPDVKRTAEGRPIAYVALHGHGTYPVSGKVPWRRLSSIFTLIAVPFRPFGVQKTVVQPVKGVQIHVSFRYAYPKQHLDYTVP